MDHLAGSTFKTFVFHVVPTESQFNPFLKYCYETRCRSHRGNQCSLSICVKQTVPYLV